MSATDSKPWIVLKFGGTSVSTAARWGRIADRVESLVETHLVCVVASALSQVSNRLERAVEEALQGAAPTAYQSIKADHDALARELGVSGPIHAPVAELLSDLQRLLDGITLTREASPRLRARVMSFGELASTRLGIGALAVNGIEADWVDAGGVLRTTVAPEQHDADRYLNAHVEPIRAPDRVEDLVGDANVVLTQGFIARDAEGQTCLLGRGGSDTSGALFAALLGAERYEVWTDVHGIFTADPRKIPSARLIRQVDSREAGELAAMGAKVLHPRSLGPAAWANIPVHVRNTDDPDGPGTEITTSDTGAAGVTAVVQRSGVTLLNISTLAMWSVPGFLAKAFTPFADLGISVDLVATSQSAVSVTLDHIPGGTDGSAFRTLVRRLEVFGTVTVVKDCAVVSIVGRRIRTVLHAIGPALEVFREQNVHLVSESAEDLNLSFVVDADAAPRLVSSLHARLFPAGAANPRLGPTWEALQTARPAPTAPRRTWWRDRRTQLLDLCPPGEARYVYDLDRVRRQATGLTSTVTSVGRFFYAMKANSHPAILRTLAAAGFGMECVSLGEVERVREVLGDDVPVLFTPNFCPPDEYAAARALGAEITVDGPDALRLRPDDFRGTEVALRVDPGGGAGHHESVVTAGANAKFGHPLSEIESFLEAAAALDVRVIGLHAHVGSGILDAQPWTRTGQRLAAVRHKLPDLKWVDLGGGLGVVERPGQTPLDLVAVQRGIASLASETAGLEIRMEPGRYLVSEAGVLLARVTQVRRKGATQFVGLATGMNSLIRPMLYGAWHGIHNLSRLDEPATESCHVVGPICETGDILGRDRHLPPTQPGDVVLIENCGAYGAAMGSTYNLRPVAPEVTLG